MRIKFWFNCFAIKNTVLFKNNLYRIESFYQKIKGPGCNLTIKLKWVFKIKRPHCLRSNQQQYFESLT